MEDTKKNNIDNALNITEKDIIRLVDAFYSKVRNDNDLGPIFDSTIGKNWDKHLHKMYNFWSSVMQLSRSYRGNPMKAHMRLKVIKPEHFSIWINLFKETAYEQLNDKKANDFISKAEQIANALNRNMFHTSIRK